MLWTLLVTKFTVATSKAKASLSAFVCCLGARACRGNCHIYTFAVTPVLDLERKTGHLRPRASSLSVSQRWL